jgi:zinc/manganese transport system substrate-binding protein
LAPTPRTNFNYFHRKDFKKMKAKLLLLIVSLMGPTVPAKINVVATLPDFGVIAQEIGRDQVNVTTIAKATEDPHFVDARPSFIRILNKADILIEGGAELEIGWLPPLVNAARNKKILADAQGHIVLGRNIRLLEVPTAPVDRSMGDVHPLGNPHFWLDPANGKIIAEVIAERLAKMDSRNAAVYQGNLRQFTERLDKKITEWTAAMKPFQGTKVLTYHKSYEYLAQRFGLNVVGQLEPKPGIEPSPTHINALIPRAKQEGVKLVLVEPFRPRRTPEYVASQIGAKLLVVPDKTGANEKVKTYTELFDFIVRQIADALKASP